MDPEPRSSSHAMLRDTAASTPSPLALSDLLDSAFRIYRAYVLQFIRPVALLFMPVLALQAGSAVASRRHAGLDRYRALERGSAYSPECALLAPSNDPPNRSTAVANVQIPSFDRRTTMLHQRIE